MLAHLVLNTFTSRDRRRHHGTRHASLLPLPPSSASRRHTCTICTRLAQLGPGTMEPGFMAGSNPLLSEIFTRISPNPSHCAPITAARRCSNLGLPTPNFVWRSPIWNPGSQQPMAAAVASPKLGFAFVRREGARGCESVSTATRIRTCSLSELADGRWDDSLRGSAPSGCPCVGDEIGNGRWDNGPLEMELGFGHGGLRMSWIGKPSNTAGQGTRLPTTRNLECRGRERGAQKIECCTAQAFPVRVTISLQLSPIGGNPL